MAHFIITQLMMPKKMHALLMEKEEERRETTGNCGTNRRNHSENLFHALRQSAVGFWMLHQQLLSSHCQQPVVAAGC
jgi:hypothetical protein